MRVLVNGKAWLLLALLVNGAVAAYSYTFPAPLPGVPEPASRQANPPVPVPEARGEAALPDLVCRRWGPVGDPSAFASLTMRIEAAGGTVEIMETPVASASDHLVLIDPAASPAATRRLRDELRSQSIPNQLMNEALRSPECSTPLTPQDQPGRGRDLSNCPKEARFAAALSVGVFADLGAATALQAELAALGYRVRVETLDSPRNAYYLQAQSPRSVPAFPLPPTACRQG